MISSDQIREILQLQYDFNYSIAKGGCWEDLNHPYYLAIAMEASEFIDHLGWKWWSGKAPNTEQAFIELVDIVHFMASISILNNQTPADIYNEMQEMPGHSDNPITIAKDLIVKQLLDKNQYTYWGHVNLLVQLLGYTMQDVYKMYIGKNALNYFRQTHGYKTGDYAKTWDVMGGRYEDNEVLAMILGELQDDAHDTFKYVTARLETIYFTRRNIK